MLITSKSECKGAYFRCDVVNIRDGCGIDESILNEMSVTGTFFSLNNTTESLPLIPTAVSPQVFTALKAY